MSNLINMTTKMFHSRCMKSYDHRLFSLFLCSVKTDYFHGIISYTYKIMLVDNAGWVGLFGVPKG